MPAADASPAVGFFHLVCEPVGEPGEAPGGDGGRRRHMCDAAGKYRTRRNGDGDAEVAE
jgi:hypothetical protein